MSFNRRLVVKSEKSTQVVFLKEIVHLVRTEESTQSNLMADVCAASGREWSQTLSPVLFLAKRGKLNTFYPQPDFTLGERQVGKQQTLCCSPTVIRAHSGCTNFVRSSSDTSSENTRVLVPQITRLSTTMSTSARQKPDGCPLQNETLLGCPLCCCGKKRSPPRCPMTTRTSAQTMTLHHILTMVTHP